MSETIETLWQISQLAGIGGCVVLIPSVILLWRQHKEDIDYIREADRNTLQVLNDLSAHLSRTGEASKDIVDKINELKGEILQHLAAFGRGRE